MSIIFQNKNSISQLTESMLEAYALSGFMHHLDHCPLPNYDAVVQAIDDLKEVLFPGYRHHDLLHTRNVIYHVGDLFDRLHDDLTAQFERAICSGTEANADCSTEKLQSIRQRSSDIALTFLHAIPVIRGMLALDVIAAEDGDPACKSRDEVVMCYPGFEAITIHRLAHSLHHLGIPLIPRMMSEYAHSKTGIDIHPGAHIDSSFFIDHGTGVVVGETSRIGNNVKIYQGVTLGARSFPKDENGNLVRNTKRHPTIEDNVVIYANATVLGDITVGHDSEIGASAWVTSDVPPHSKRLKSSR